MPTTLDTADRPVGVSRTSPPEQLARIADGMDALAARAARSVDAAAELHDGVAMDGVASLLGAIDRLLATVIVVLMRCERRRVVREQGLTIESWLRAVAGRTGADAGMLMIAAERLADMPATLRAFRDGVLSWGTVRGIVCAVKALTSEQRRWLDGALAADDARLRSLDGDAVVAAADRLVDEARPDLQRERAQRAAAGQRLVLQPGMDGSGMAIAAMDAETFTAVQTAIETITHDAAGRRVSTNIEALRALARQRLARIGRNATARQGDRAEGADAPVRRSDAHTREAEASGRVSAAQGADARDQVSDTPARVADDDDGRRKDIGGAPSTARPEMIVVTDVSLLLDPTDAVEQVTSGSVATPSDVAQLLWRQDRPPPSLTPAAVRRLACDATVRPVLTDGAKVLGTAEPYAKVSASLRAALIARDGGCRFAACHRPVDVCEAHHVVQRFRGGPTVLDNLALLCTAHHHAVHEGGWRATLHDDGSMLFVRRGVTLRSLPRGGQMAAPRRPPPEKPGRRRPARPRRSATDDNARSEAPTRPATPAHLPF